MNKAIRRASKWISYQLTGKDGETSVMIGQVGGVSVHKRPLLTLGPDYVMKPVQTDHRGIREIVLYEAVKCCRDKNRNNQHYAGLLTGGETSNTMNNKKSKSANSLKITISNPVLDLWDTLAMWMAMKMNDPIVAQHEKTINKSWKALKKEVDTLMRLSAFIPSYYGVVGQRSPLSMPVGEEQAHKAAQQAATANYDETGNSVANTPPEFHDGLSLEAHLLLMDMTANFRKPCVMDLKMGRQTYEPDAPDEKKTREINKYPQQEQFGFRIVGMRFYDPLHPESDADGYRFFPKEYGRSLATVEDVLDALRLFLTAGCVTQQQQQQQQQQQEQEGGDTQGEDGEKQQQTINGSANGSGNDETLSKDAPSQQQDEKPESNMSLDQSEVNNNNSYQKSSSEEEKDLAEKERLRIRALSGILAHLRPICGFMDENQTLSFHASSLLIIYEGDRAAPNPDATSVKMIDFGRVRRQSGGDPSYNHGLLKFKNLMNKIHKEEKQRLRETD